MTGVQTCALPILILVFSHFTKLAIEKIKCLKTSIIIALLIFYGLDGKGKRDKQKKIYFTNKIEYCAEVLLLTPVFRIKL